MALLQQNHIEGPGVLPPMDEMTGFLTCCFCSGHDTEGLEECLSAD